MYLFTLEWNMVVLFLVLLVSYILRNWNPFKDFRTSPMQGLQVEANEPSLYLRFDKLCIKYTLKLRSNPDNPAYNVVFNPRLYDLHDKKPSEINLLGIV